MHVIEIGKCKFFSYVCSIIYEKELDARFDGRCDPETIRLPRFVAGGTLKSLPERIPITRTILQSISNQTVLPKVRHEAQSCMMRSSFLHTDFKI